MPGGLKLTRLVSHRFISLIHKASGIDLIPVR